MRERADKVLVSQGLAGSRHKAQALIMAGLVYADGQRIEKPGQFVNQDIPLFLKETMPYVSRGGLKLEEALRVFQVSVKGKVAADLGASTGGFTDCLIQNGAEKVYAVDVDTRQMDWELSQNPRVVRIKKNARSLVKSDFQEELDLVTMDLSFISVVKVLPAVREFLGKGLLLALIKPQFEAGKGMVGKGGVVRNPELHEKVLSRVAETAWEMGFFPEKLMRSSVKGQKGNQEFFICWSLSSRKNFSSHSRILKLIKEALGDEKN